LNGIQEIRISKESYSRIFAAHGMDWQQAKERARGFIKAIEKSDLRYLEEMKGIAQGAGLEMEGILSDAADFGAKNL